MINLGGIIPDDPGKLPRRIYRRRQPEADVVTAPAASRLVKRTMQTILEELGEIAFWKLAIKRANRCLRQKTQ